MVEEEQMGEPALEQAILASVHLMEPVEACTYN
jgi:hypothetical protein